MLLVGTLLMGFWMFLVTHFDLNNTTPLNSLQPASVPNNVLRRKWLSFDILTYPDSREELHRSVFKLFGMNVPGPGTLKILG